MSADIIITNGRVITMDETLPHAEAVAIAGNKILFTGDTLSALSHRKASTRIIDAQGGTVLPGLIEAHMHLFPGATEIDNLQLQGVHGFQALEQAIRAYAASRPGARLLIGQQADYTILSDIERVTRRHLDRIIPDRPFIMFSPDHHTAWANTIALEKAGILKGRKLGPGNEIVMGDDGLAAGELREGEAINPVQSLSGSGNRERLGLSTGGEPEPPPTPEEFEYDLTVIKRGLAHLAKHGLTSFHNMDGNLYQLQLLEALEARGELTARGRIPFHFKNFMEVSALEKASEMSARYHSDRLASGFVKLFVDGVLDSWTAVMVEDYADRKGWVGEPLFTRKQFAKVATEIDKRGLQIAVHAIGDGAVRIVLDGYEAARKANGPRDSRHRIEHIEVVHPDDIPRFRELGVIASMQPPHPPGSQGLPLEPTVSRIGRDRWAYSYAWNTLRDAGAHLVFATDWPVSDINPIRSIQSAVTRKKWADDLPDQRQTLEQAISGYTRDGAFTEFKEDRKGRLKHGMLADVTVLSGDMETTDPEALHEIVPIVTITDGKIVYMA
ncbi:MAG: amidohydrolase [Rhizobiales bacterium]|nr:amidohydrolase [Hyphomicrobiales bacterium]